MKINLSFALALGLCLCLTQVRADAHSRNNLTVTDGYGDGFAIHHGLLGYNNDIQFQDRLGDKYVKHHGLTSKETAMGVFGNQVVERRGLIGGTKVQASDMLGDSVYSHKTFFGLGPRQTNVNLSGVGGIVQSIAGSHFGGNQMPNLVDTSNFANQGPPPDSNSVQNSGQTPLPVP